MAGIGDFARSFRTNDNGEPDLVLAAGIHSAMHSWKQVIAEERARNVAAAA